LRSSDGEEIPRACSPRWTRSSSIPLPETDRAASSTFVPGTDDGMVIIDLWDSRDDFEEMMSDPEFQENLKRAGTPGPDSLEVYEVHATVP
jgi:hypothetical protein